MRARLLTAGLVAVMAFGSLALWTAIPAGWLWVARDLQPDGARFTVTILGCVASMMGAGSLLHRLESLYFRVSGAPAPDHAHPPWLPSIGDGPRPQRRLSLLDSLLAASAVLALAALVLWWALLADSPNPSVPLQPL